ncbi:cannabidiolic acid synthase-like 1 [Dorcoceras hygrometricum]|uniref:Cannabidiolic acid synthase-like 1 n=1 Tax=Dorcoceras hygrometricum TaxID=472368 RepID=A0A2Z7DC13_9LAMI|nr:cannabidiolic acid synthase-like 1 [Dorcoceras hygrometricum]
MHYHNLHFLPILVLISICCKIFYAKQGDCTLHVPPFLLEIYGILQLHLHSKLSIRPQSPTVLPAESQMAELTSSGPEFIATPYLEAEIQLSSSVARSTVPFIITDLTNLRSISLDLEDEASVESSVTVVHHALDIAAKCLDAHVLFIFLPLVP